MAALAVMTFALFTQINRTTEEVRYDRCLSELLFDELGAHRAANELAHDRHSRDLSVQRDSEFAKNLCGSD